nr:uncharacterized protein LOC101126927 [Gorilla gorilla gorilla]
MTASIFFLDELIIDWPLYLGKTRHHLMDVSLKGTEHPRGPRRGRSWGALAAVLWNSLVFHARSGVLLAPSRHPALPSEARLLAGEGRVLARRDLGLVPHGVSGVSSAARSTPQGQAVCSPSVAAPSTLLLLRTHLLGAASLQGCGVLHILPIFLFSKGCRRDAQCACTVGPSASPRSGRGPGRGGGRRPRLGAARSGCPGAAASGGPAVLHPWRRAGGRGRGASPPQGPQTARGFPLPSRWSSSPIPGCISTYPSPISFAHPGSLAPLGSPFPSPGPPSRSRLLCPGLRRGLTPGRWFRPDLGSLVTPRLLPLPDSGEPGIKPCAFLFFLLRAESTLHVCQGISSESQWRTRSFFFFPRSCLL